MTYAEEAYCGAAGAAYWERNADKVREQRLFRYLALRDLIPWSMPLNADVRLRWLEIGCGRGDNLTEGDVGLDCDARQLTYLPSRRITTIFDHAYDLSMFIDNSFPVVFSVGCLMHLPRCGRSCQDRDRNAGYPEEPLHQCWPTAAEEMGRVSSRYVILGEYWAEGETRINSPHWQGCLWARPYTVPGYTEIKRVKPLAPFDPEVTFTIWEKQ